MCGNMNDHNYVQYGARVASITHKAVTSHYSDGQLLPAGLVTRLCQANNDVRYDKKRRIFIAQHNIRSWKQF